MTTVATPWSETSDAGHPAVAAFLAAAPDAYARFGESPAASDALTAVLFDHPLAGKPSEAWWADASAAVAGLDAADAITTALVSAVADCTAFTKRTEALGAAMVRVAGIAGAADAVPVLARVVARMVDLSVRIALAGAWAIAAADQPSSTTELVQLERTLRQGLVLVELRAGLDTIAAARGLTREQLAERGIETHGLAPDGTRQTRLGNGGAAQLIVDCTGVTLGYLDPTATPRKTFPKAVRDADGATLTALKAEVRVLRKAVSVERARMDRLVGSGRSWALEDWRAFYLGHPVVGRFAERLIWTFTPAGESAAAVTGIPQNASTVRTANGTDAAIPEGATVALWHPVLAPGAEVAAWRDRCRADDLAQPVKQAFRETYVLAPAERVTATYSNRFAAHVVRQQQTRTLLRSRGWTSIALAWWDDGNNAGVAKRAFSDLGVRAELFYDPIVDVAPQGGDLYPLCTTDQLRFRTLDGDPVDLTEVPPVALSEALRDADLIVSVASIGADAAWIDAGVGREHEAYQDYWRAYVDAPLETLATNRRETLAELLPALEIAGRCELTDRHLVVHGDCASYEIHLGSAAVFTAAEHRHICIVPARSAKLTGGYLPFDDDRTLTLILSKAVLLADDRAITDPTILQQLGR